MRPQDGASVTQCDSIGSSNSSGIGRTQDKSISNSASEYNIANLRNTSELVAMQLVNAVPATQRDQTGHSNTNGSNRDKDNSISCSASADNSTDPKSTNEPVSVRPAGEEPVTQYGHTDKSHTNGSDRNNAGGSRDSGSANNSAELASNSGIATTHLDERVRDTIFPDVPDPNCIMTERVAVSASGSQEHGCHGTAENKTAKGLPK